MVLFFLIKTKTFNVGDEYYDMLIKDDLKDYSKKLEDVSNTTYIVTYVTKFIYQKGFGTTETSYYPFGLIDFN
ncbi:MAG: hypothetical protein NC310_05140 [Roseburia sp.]|nr:hypothetical protein [Anaeroplasma bactoclasticum]MCM1196444.1 hypothetical protein [Roseburia sp.]